MVSLKNVEPRRLVTWISLSGVCVALVVLLVMRWNSGSDPYSFEHLTEDVTLVCRETGKEITMPRGRMEQMLWDRQGALDPSVGLPNPDTGRMTMFPKSEWEQTIERINVNREAVANKGQKKGGESGK